MKTESFLTDKMNNNNYFLADTLLPFRYLVVACNISCICLLRERQFGKYRRGWPVTEPAFLISLLILLVSPAPPAEQSKVHCAHHIYVMKISMMSHRILQHLSFLWKLRSVLIFSSAVHVDSQVLIVLHHISILFRVV